MLGEEVGDRLVLAVELQGLAGGIRIPLVGDQPHRVDRRRNRLRLPLGQHRDVLDAERRQAGDRPPAGGSEADDRGSQPAPVIAGHPGELEGVDDGAVAGQLVVLVEDVEVERAVAAPMVHLLPGDQRQPALDGDLRDLLVLHAVHPSPEHGALGQLEQVRRHRLRDQQHVARLDQLIA